MEVEKFFISRLLLYCLLWQKGRESFYVTKTEASMPLRPLGYPDSLKWDGTTVQELHFHFGLMAFTILGGAAFKISSASNPVTNSHADD